MFHGHFFHIIHLSWPGMGNEMRFMPGSGHFHGSFASERPGTVWNIEWEKGIERFHREVVKSCWCLLQTIPNQWFFKTLMVKPQSLPPNLTKSCSLLVSSYTRYCLLMMLPCLIRMSTHFPTPCFECAQFNDPFVYPKWMCCPTSGHILEASSQKKPRCDEPRRIGSQMICSGLTLFAYSILTTITGWWFGAWIL